MNEGHSSIRNQASSSSSPKPVRPSSSSQSEREEKNGNVPSSGTVSPNTSDTEGGEDLEKEKNTNPVKILSDTQMDQLKAKVVETEIMIKEHNMDLLAI